MPTWPASLPALPKSGTFTYAPEPNIVEFKPDVGRSQKSLRYTLVRTPYEAQMDLTEAQAEILVAFFIDDCAQGVSSFFMADWRGGATKRFSFASGYTPQPQHIAGDDWIVGLSLVRES